MMTVCSLQPGSVYVRCLTNLNMKKNQTTDKSLKKNFNKVKEAIEAYDNFKDQSSQDELF